MANLKDALYQPLFRYHMAEANASKALPEGALRTNAVRTAAFAESGALLIEVGANPNVNKFLDKLSSPEVTGKINEEQGRALSDAIIKQYKTDKGFISKLEKDLADPATAAKLQAAVTSNPAGVTASLKNYTGGNLAAILPAAAAPAPAATDKTQDKTRPAPDDETARLARRNPAPAQTSKPAGGTTTAGQSTSSPTTTTTTAPPSPAEVAAAAVDKSLDDPNPPSDKELAGAALKKIASGTDDEIRKAITPDFVKGLANGLADYGTENFNLGPEAKGFRDKINSEDKPGGLQERIAENLKKNPQLIRELAGAMDNKEAANGPAGSAIKGKLQDIYAAPSMLADKDKTDELMGDIKRANGGLAGMLSGLFGDGAMKGVGGMLNGIGGFFKGIMNWFGNFIDAFSSGNFAVMGNVDPKMSMWDKISYSMDRSANAAMLRGSERILPRDGATNPKVGNGMVVDAAGKPVMEPVLDNTGKPIGERQKYDPTQDHRVSIGGHKFYITGNLQPTPVLDKDGNFTGKSRFYVATDLKEDGRAATIKEVVLNKEDTNKAMERIEQAAKAAGVESGIVHPESAPNRTEKSRIVSSYIEPKTGAVTREGTPLEAPANDTTSPGVRTFPVKDPNIEVKPLPSPAAVMPLS